MRPTLCLLLLACSAGGEEPAPPATPTRCEAAGLTARPWQEAEPDPGLGALAADVTVATPDGPWTLSERWTGCDTYLFLLDQPRQNGGIATWDEDADVRALLKATPENTHLFFISTTADDDARANIQAEMAKRVDKVVRRLDETVAATWEGRLHFADRAAGDLPGWLGQALTDPGWGVGIDRFQRIRYVGSYADPERYSAAIEWFEPNLAMAANEAVYYNFESDRQDRLDAQEATVVPLWTGEVISDPSWAGARTSVDVDLPDAATLATFDTLELDLSLLCQGEGEFGTCPAWDYINALWLCDEANPESCSTEFGRWITTYHREGRWVTDVTPLLPLIQGGGTRRFQFYSQQPYETHLALRFSHQGHADRPVELLRLWSLQGGSMVAGYNDRPPVTLDLPADAARVELVTTITGHGMVEPGELRRVLRDHPPLQGQRRRARAELARLGRHLRLPGADGRGHRPQPVRHLVVRAQRLVPRARGHAHPHRHHGRRHPRAAQHLRVRRAVPGPGVHRRRHDGAGGVGRGVPMIAPLRGPFRGCRFATSQRSSSFNAPLLNPLIPPSVFSVSPPFLRVQN
jgi:hypothetical protein